MTTDLRSSTDQPVPFGTKGLRIGAIGLLSSLVIGVASTAPAYSIAATLGFVTKEVGTKAPIVMLLAFLPMLCVSYAYRALNEVTPDCGTSFTWVAQAFGRYSGWITGWVIIVADVIVMANLAQVAGRYSLDLLGFAGSTASETALGCSWIALMTVIAWRGIQLSARTQAALLGTEMAILVGFAVVALAKVYTGRAGTQAIQPELAWFNPIGGGMTVSALSAGFLLAVFIYWGWDSAVSTNEETENPSVIPGRAAVLSTVVLLITYVLVTVAAQAYAGTASHGLGLANPRHLDDPLSGLGAAVLGGWGAKALLLAILSSAAASTQTTILPTARTTLAMAVYRALPRRFAEIQPRHKTPSFSTWVMGGVSIVFYAGLVWYDERTLGDLIASLGLLIAFYYGLTGFAAAWVFRHDLLLGARVAVRNVLLPLLGGVSLLVAFVLTAVDSYAAEFGETAPFGIGGVFLLGVGSIIIGVLPMIAYRMVSPAYFRRWTMIDGTVVTETGEIVTTAGPVNAQEE
jgi:amino acid transporter